jgi:GMP synthase (glutamine-hydrolysing)
MAEDDFSGLNIVVVDNGGQWTHREYRVIRDLGATVRIMPNTSGLAEIADADGLVLSGGSPSVGLEPEKMGKEGEYLDAFSGPILGICVGHHFIAHHYGGETGRGKNAEFGRARLIVISDQGILNGVPVEFTVWESHRDEVRKPPEGFVVLAKTEDCPVEAMMSSSRPLYGVQFHPEVEETEYGVLIFRNFLQEVRRWKSAAK